MAEKIRRNGMKQGTEGNPLGCMPIGPLMRKFAMPSIVGMLVTSIYNIVDQLFIGQAVGELGNAATNIAFPSGMICVAIALTFGIGGAASFNLSMGEGRKEEAPFYIGNAFLMLVLCGFAYFAVTRILLEPMVLAFGAPPDVLPYAMDYVGITSFGFPFVIITVGGGHLIRADGSPTKAMAFNLSGALINIFLDYLFTMVIKWGISGAALATIIGQIFSAVLTIVYMFHFKTVPLKKEHFRPQGATVRRVAALGISACVNQLSLMAMQVVSNNLLKIYGEQSIYGATIPIACAGIVIKLNMVVFSVLIGIAQGCQPIYSFNYGAQNYARVREAFKKSMIAGLVVSAVALFFFEVFPRQIFSIFGNGSELYMEYGEMYLRVFMMFLCLSVLQPMSNTFFAAIGKPIKGTIMALVKQVCIMIPMMFILTAAIGVNGVMYSGPVSDVGAGILSIIFLVFEFKDIHSKEAALAQSTAGN